MTGRNVRVRNLALARARHLDGHGAAIRAEGRNLSLRAVLIEDNQDGIFAPGLAGGVLRIERSIFRSSGAMPGSTPSAAVRAGSVDVLLIRDTVFEDGQGKAAILSGAGWTGLEGCRIGGGARLEGAVVMVEGGLRAVRNRVEGGESRAARCAGGQPRGSLVVRPAAMVAIGLAGSARARPGGAAVAAGDGRLRP
jgi:hypothetical protein